AEPPAIVVGAADRDDLGIRAHPVEQPGTDQVVVYDHVCSGEAALATYGQETRVTGAGPDQIHAAGHRQAVDRGRIRSTISRAPAASKRSAKLRPSASA